jgi:hypothetical protein
MIKPEISEEDFLKYIEDRLVLTQTSFDHTKGTMITAGLFVAASISLPNLHNVLIFHHTGIKVVLALATLSAIALVFSFVFAENQSKAFERIALKGHTSSKVRKLILGEYTLRKAKILSWYYIRFHNFMATSCNNLASLFLILGLASYLYILVR